LKKFIFSAFNSEYIDKYGASWIASLKEKSNFNGIVVLIALGYSCSKVVDALKLEGITVINADDEEDRRKVVFDIIANLQKHSDGVYAYWDIDGYFNGDVNEIFDMCNDGNVHIANNSSLGFVCGNNQAWNIYSQYRDFENACGLKPSMYEFITQNHSVSLVDSCWNCLAIDSASAIMSKFYHYPRIIRNTPDGMSRFDFYFDKTNQDMHDRWRHKIFGGLKPSMKRFIVNRKNKKD